MINSRTVLEVERIYSGYDSTYTSIIESTFKGMHGALLVHGIDYLSNRHDEYRQACWQTFVREVGSLVDFNKVYAYLMLRVIGGDVISLNLATYILPQKSSDIVTVDYSLLTDRLIKIYKDNLGKLEVPCIVNGLHGGLIISIAQMSGRLGIKSVGIAT